MLSSDTFYRCNTFLSAYDVPSALVYLPRWLLCPRLLADNSQLSPSPPTTMTKPISLVLQSNIFPYFHLGQINDHKLQTWSATTGNSGRGEIRWMPSPLSGDMMKLEATLAIRHTKLFRFWGLHPKPRFP